MHVLKRKTLVDFYRHPDFQDAKGPLEVWYYEVKQAKWTTPADVKAKFSTASILKNNRVIFNIAGNKYRLVVRVNYHSKTVFVRFIGTHTQYDKIDAEEI